MSAANGENDEAIQPIRRIESVPRIRISYRRVARACRGTLWDSPTRPPSALTTTGVAAIPLLLFLLSKLVRRCEASHAHSRRVFPRSRDGNSPVPLNAGHLHRGAACHISVIDVTSSHVGGDGGRYRAQQPSPRLRPRPSMQQCGEDRASGARVTFGDRDITPGGRLMAVTAGSDVHIVPITPQTAEVRVTTGGTATSICR